MATERHSHQPQQGLVECASGEFIYKLHLKTDISFCVQFNTEFPRQEMNFPTLVVTTPIYLFSSVRFVTVK